MGQDFREGWGWSSDWGDFGMQKVFKDIVWIRLFQVSGDRGEFQGVLGVVCRGRIRKFLSGEVVQEFLDWVFKMER